ncbi:MAG: TrpB-like pyridoxal phosphate-dependent enzyme [Acidimicrobiia bacterium]|nr:TrpB-like pyridoxal phosphate-dependent enzyme [Acidimicrobiia bacterium]
MWQVRASYDQKPYRRAMMEVFGSTVHRQPSRPDRGRSEDPRERSRQSRVASASPSARRSRWRPATTRPATALGSVLNHVLLHQTVIGQEAIEQLEQTGDTPDLVVGCIGGGSNFAGLSFPFIRENLAGRLDARILGVEPAACPTLTRGIYAYDFGDTAGMTPLMKMHTLGHDFVPDPIHAGGLRYHGMSPLISHLATSRVCSRPWRVPQSECFEAGVQFARTEGIVPAPEPTHALALAAREAKRCAETGEEKVILTALCGHGLLDLAAYDKYLAGEVEDLEHPQARIEDALTRLPAGDL